MGANRHRNSLRRAFHRHACGRLVLRLCGVPLLPRRGQWLLHLPALHNGCALLHPWRHHHQRTANQDDHPGLWSAHQHDRRPSLLRRPTYQPLLPVHRNLVQPESAQWLLGWHVQRRGGGNEGTASQDNRQYGHRYRPIALDIGEPSDQHLRGRRGRDNLLQIHRDGGSASLAVGLPMWNTTRRPLRAATKPAIRTARSIEHSCSDEQDCLSGGYAASPLGAALRSGEWWVLTRALSTHY